jgi:hypothetical protein
MFVKVMLGTFRIFCQGTDDVSETNMRCDSSRIFHLRVS